MSSSLDALEYQTETSRNRVSDLLDELRDRVSPGEVVDQVVGFAGDGAGEFVRSLGRQVRDNPLPCVLAGVGLAWLMLARRTGHDGLEHTRGNGGPGEALARTTARARQSSRGSMTRASEMASDAGATARGFASDVVDAASDALSRTSDLAAELGTRAGDTADRAAQLGREAAARTAERVGDLGSRAADAAWQAGHTARAVPRRAASAIDTLLHEQPLVAAGIGLAIGAAIGALLPASETEDRLMGDGSERAKDWARRTAGGQLDRATETVESAADAARDFAGEQLERAKEAANTGTERARDFATEQIDRAQQAAGVKPGDRHEPRLGEADGPGIPASGESDAGFPPAGNATR
jgi:ElaB/YqjD/DUF883 family membrane-anchored ribosome-binding protein